MQSAWHSFDNNHSIGWTSEVKCLLVDDHILFRQSLARVLEERLPAYTFFEAGSSDDAKRQCSELDPDLILLDLTLGPTNGLSALGELRREQLSPRVLVVSMHRDGVNVVAALKARVQGFVTKDEPVETLVEAVRAVSAGRTWFSPELIELASPFLSLPGRSQGRLEDEFEPYRTLTGREQEVFLLLAEGKSVNEIAQSMKISPKTIENHRSNVYQKLGLGDRYELFLFARKLGVIS